MVFPNNPIKGAGGNKAILSSVIKEFDDAKIEITLLFLDDKASEFWDGNIKHVGFKRQKGLEKFLSMFLAIATVDLRKFFKCQQLEEYIKSEVREIDCIYFHHLYLVQGDLSRFKTVICENHVIDSRVYWEGWKNNFLVIKNLILSLLFKRLESRNAKLCDLLFTLNKKEKSNLQQYGRKVIYSPINIRYEGPKKSLLPPKKRLVFFGSLNWLPNQQTVKYLLKFERETLFFERSGFEVHILGAGLPLRIKKTFPTNGVIKFVGYVDNLNEYLLGSTAVLAFMCVGEGVRLKILEAIALGLPVFTNMEGKDGLEEDHPCLLISELEDIQEFFVDNRLLDEDFRNEVIEKSRQYIEKHHSGSVRSTFLRTI